MLSNEKLGLECAQSAPTSSLNNHSLSSSTEDMLSKEQGKKRSYKSDCFEISSDQQPNKICRKENVVLAESPEFEFEELSPKQLREKFISMLAEHKETISTYQKMTEELSAENEALKKVKLMDKEGNERPADEQSDEKLEAKAMMQLSDYAPNGRCFYRRRIGKKVEYVMVAYLRLCADVLGDVLQFAVRRQLSALERVGDRFYYVIAGRFAAKPFLNLSLTTFFDAPIDMGDKFLDYYLSAPGIPMGTEALMKAKKVSGVSILGLSDFRIDAVYGFVLDAKITETDLPAYLRFDSIELQIGEHDAYEKPFELISPLLLQLKPALIGSRLVLTDSVEINELYFVHAKLLPFFECCTQFELAVKCNPEECSVSLASILLQPSIEKALNVDISFYYREDEPSAEMPIEAISKWLNNPHPSIITSAQLQSNKNNKKGKKKRSLNVYISNTIGNLMAVVDHLKKVFKAAQTPVHPFELSISFSSNNGLIVEQNKIVLNKISHEQLSISISKAEYSDRFKARIVRSTK